MKKYLLLILTCLTISIILSACGKAIADDTSAVPTEAAATEAEPAETIRETLPLETAPSAETETIDPQIEAGREYYRKHNMMEYIETPEDILKEPTKKLLEFFVISRFMFWIMNTSSSLVYISYDFAIHPAFEEAVKREDFLPCLNELIIESKSIPEPCSQYGRRLLLIITQQRVEALIREDAEKGIRYPEMEQFREEWTWHEYLSYTSLAEESIMQ